MTRYWVIRSNPEELDDVSHNKKMEKCLSDNRIYVGVPDTLPAFKKRVSIGDYFVTKNKDGTCYVGKITGNCQEHAINDLHYRKVEWLNDKKSVDDLGQFFGPEHYRTCTQLNEKEVAIIEPILKGMKLL